MTESRADRITEQDANQRSIRSPSGSTPSPVGARQIATKDAFCLTIAKLTALLLIDPEGLSDQAYKALREAGAKIDMVLCRNEEAA